MALTPQEFTNILEEEKSRVLGDVPSSSPASIALTQAMWAPLIQRLNDIRTDEYSLADILLEVESDEIKELVRSGAENYIRQEE